MASIDQPQPGVIPGRTPSLTRFLAGVTSGQQPVWTTDSQQAPNVTSPTGATGATRPSTSMDAPTSVTGTGAIDSGM